MLMQSKATAAAVALGGALTLFAGPAMAKSPLTTVHCGQTLTQSVKLANDLTNCPAPGLAIGADAITVDLNGHTIDGVVTQTDTCRVLPFGIPGIDTGGHNGLTIKNGTVQQFLNGIAVGPGEFEGPPTVGMANSVVRDITARDNSFVGIGIGGDELTSATASSTTSLPEPDATPGSSFTARTATASRTTTRPATAAPASS